MISAGELATLWRQHARGLCLLARTRCQFDADDVVQDAFIRLAACETLPDDPVAWLARTIRNLSIDLARREGRRRTREKRFAESKASWFQPDALTQLVAAEVTEALDSLPTHYREILVAHLWNSMSFRQIAAAFDLSSSSAARRYHEALHEMRSALSTHDPSLQSPIATQDFDTLKARP